MTNKGTEDDIRIRAVQTSFEIIDQILELDGARLTDLVNQLDKPKSTVYDYVITLENLGYITKRNGAYQVSMRFLDIGTRIREQMSIVEVAKPQLRKLAHESGENASLMIEENGTGIIVETVESDDSTQIGVRPGKRLLLHTSAAGKAILAHLPEERVEAIIDSHGLIARNENTTTDPASLLDELEQIRRQKYATNQAERRRGTHGVAAPIRCEDGVVGAVTIYGPAHDIENAVDELSNMALRTANIIEVTLDYS